MTETTPPQDTVSVVISANDSLSRNGSLLFFGSIFAFTVLISGGWASLGYWPVLPFAGLELAVLGIALYLCRLRAAYRELLVITPSEVSLERGRSSRREQFQWPRPWVRVALERGANNAGQRRLLLRSAGNEVEIARMLTEAERRALHARLRQLLSDGV